MTRFWALQRWGWFLNRNDVLQHCILKRLAFNLKRSAIKSLRVPKARQGFDGSTFKRGALRAFHNRVDSVASGTALKPGWTRGRALLLGLAALGFACAVYFHTAFALVLNGTQSLPHSAYVMVQYPKVMRLGRYSLFEPTEIFQREFGFVKEVIGLPGDVIVHRAGQVCVRTRCLTPQSGYRSLALLTPEGVIPKGHYFMAGAAPDSLDSRYAALGLVHLDQIKAVGVAIPRFPHWTVLNEWVSR